MLRASALTFLSPQHAHAVHRAAEVSGSRGPRPLGTPGEGGAEAAGGGGAVEDAGRRGAGLVASGRGLVQVACLQHACTC